VFLEVHHVFGESCPRNFKLHIALARYPAALHLVAERAHRSLAKDLCGHTLTKLALGSSVGDQRTLRVREHVDEAWSYG
jgi:hypothetical protein